eukprot:TRINITY_DN14236_c0_g1_i1.p5 TRINITY_DN14236_c0_g1~~TRINITY_DN14236_c0_g1_i1.p5  ORF type:complete len:152 (-),score=13.68 TRINITY_DN14236_c0_g1_i1:349-804(-)
MIHFFLLVNKQGKLRLSKWYSTYSQKQRSRVTKEATSLILARAPQLCNFVDWRGLKLVYKRYASLYFVCAVDADDNELITLDMIHHFVEVLDKHFSNVCELDLVFHFYKAYWLMDEVFLAGEMEEPSKKAACNMVREQDEIVEEQTHGHPF